MAGDPHTHIHPPANVRVALMHSEKPPVHFYRYLYNKVGEGLYWIDRKKMPDGELAEAIHGEGIDLFMAYVDGAPAGFFELDAAREPDCVWLAYFRHHRRLSGHRSRQVAAQRGHRHGLV